MGNVYRKQVTRPLPPGAEIIERKGERLARWRDARGKIRTAPLTESGDRIRETSRTFHARYRTGEGTIADVPTGCRDEQAARAVLADLEKRAEMVKAGILKTAELQTADHARTPIAEHFDAYLNHHDAAGSVALHRHNVRTYLDRIAADCGFRRLADLDRSAFESWLSRETKRGRSARSRNTHRATLIAFCHWCSRPEVARLASNPFKGIPKADEKADPRRKRRAMTESELTRLLDVARTRPLTEALTVRRGKAKGSTHAKVRPEVRERLDALGRERALIYKTLILTGLRKGELTSLTIGQACLDGPRPYLDLSAADEKNREGAWLPLRADLADDLRQWLADRLTSLQDDARGQGEPIPVRLPADMPLFNVPAGLIRIFDRDLKAAGIAKRDDRGRTLDVHALRTSFGTLLSAGGVPLRTAQAAMRHSDPSLTANVYTDPRLLDVAGALDALPALRLDRPDVDSMRATGTVGGSNPSARLCQGPVTSVALNVAANPCNERQGSSIGGKMNRTDLELAGPDRFAVTSISDRGNHLVSLPDTGFPSVCPAGLEPATFSSGG